VLGQVNDEPTQRPLVQVSLVVQALLSEHGAVSLLVYKQPTLGLHVSDVQGLLSLQTTADDCEQTKLRHVSFVVQGFKSSQAVPLGLFVHVGIRPQVGQLL
jgi:hypothetical protein